LEKGKGMTVRPGRKGKLAAIRPGKKPFLQKGGAMYHRIRKERSPSECPFRKTIPGGKKEDSPAK